jgi:hypothetical protein
VATLDAQVRKLMTEYQKHGKVEIAALRSGMHRNTAGKYIKAGELPSELTRPRTWRTRMDPFEEHWPAIVEKLRDAPALEAKTLFEDLCERHPRRYQPGQLRTLQRRIKAWRAQEGPEKEVFFAQQHRPGEAMQTDFTSANELGITLGGEPFDHLLCHSVLPYSNWEWATACLSESMSALRRGVQASVFELGHVTEWLQTDHSSAATHDLRTGKRGFNEEYEALVRHLGMKPRTIAVGKKEQNGDVESLNGWLKRRLEQHLLLRGSRDFPDRAAYETWIRGVLRKYNARRGERLVEELAVMRELTAQRLAEYTEHEARVTAWSTIRLKAKTYSVPSRLMRELVKVRLFEDRIEVFYGGQRQLTTERLRGSKTRRIDYRHVIWSLVKKPGAFARFRYRDELFPSPTFRRAYDRLAEAHVPRIADREYLRVLHLAASTFECHVEEALESLLSDGEVPDYERVRPRIETSVPETPAIEPLKVDLGEYDELLLEVSA